MNKEKLEALYTMLSENLLIDSTFIDNIPFSKDGRIAFIDTEHYNSTLKEVCYEMVGAQLSPNMQEHWNQLINKTIQPR